MNFLSRKLPFTVVFIGLTVVLFMGRVILFANSNGAIEHDSGWYLGVAKNLAHRGFYASYTNTIREEGSGAHPSIHGRFSVQDANGFSYFPAGVTVGPGYVVPEALLLKIFGDGWWQYRLWPLIGFTLLLSLLFYIVLRIGGIISFFIFQIWLWAVPQLTTTYAYEAYSEHIATLFLFISFLLYYYSSNHIKKYWLMFLVGLSVSFSFLTKNIFLLPSLSFSTPFLLEVWIHRKNLKVLIFRWGLFFLGLLSPIILYESYRYYFLVSQFGHEGWKAINEDLRLHFQSNGSGITGLNFSNIDWSFVLKKVYIWIDVGIKEPFLIWTIILFSPFVLLKHSFKKFRVLIILFYLSFLISFVWFIFLSSYGWARHAWQGIIIGMMIISITLGSSIKNALINSKKSAFGFILILVLILGSLRSDGLELRFDLNQSTIDKWRINRFARGLEGFPSTPTLSLSDQKELVIFFNRNIRKEDRIYYAGWLLSAEASSLVDKVFYTLDRYFALNQRNPDGGKSYAIFGPYQQGPWSFMPPDYLPRKVLQLCQTVVYTNPSYTLCALRTGLSYRNEAYN